MRKILTAAAALVASATTALADEGMWILSMLSQQNMATMQQLGCKLTAEQIYSVNNSSLKDAVIIFGGGCTGEIVSDNGLIFTNHHCGYSSIQKLSSVEHNYLRDGYWAKSFEEDLPVPGLSIRMLKQFSDVTASVLRGVSADMTAKARQAIVGQNCQAIADSAQEANPRRQVSVESFFADNQYFLVEYDVYTDIRLVGCPPENIGKFGHETDNWHWPRHTGDFSIFRVYTDADNNPADYAPTNKPLKPRHFLPISLKGTVPGDYAMTIGYPGSTDRYLSSMGVEERMNIENAARIEPRDIKEKIWMENMLADEAVYIKYADKYARSSNYHMNSVGMNRGIKNLKVVKRKKAEEKAFIKWAEKNGTAEMADVVKRMKKLYADSEDEMTAFNYWMECIYSGCEITKFAWTVSRTINDPANVSAEQEEALREAAEAFYKDYVPEVDKKVSAAMLAYYGKKIAKQHHPDYFKKIYNGAGFEKFAGDLVNSSLLGSKERFFKVFDAKNFELLMHDDAIKYAQQNIDVYTSIAAHLGDVETEMADAKRIYLAGRMQMQPERAFYSDANFTCRLSYGKVGGYKAEGKTFDYYTDLAGVMAKEDPNNREFTVSARLKELYNKKDYGRYADKDGKMHVCFITDNDITGGNSGSPVINGHGELIGLAFDGNWEAMSGDIIFEPDVQRCINVDIRYVLFVIDKFGGAQNIIDELVINQ